MPETAHLVKTKIEAKKLKWHEAVTLTFIISTFNFFWYTVPHWSWGLKQLTKQKQRKK